jgi:hypothetical protein
MRTGCEPHDQEPGLRVAKAGHRPSPVLLTGELSLSFAGDVGAVVAKAGTEIAVGDLIC